MAPPSSTTCRGTSVKGIPNKGISKSGRRSGRDLNPPTTCYRVGPRNRDRLATQLSAATPALAPLVGQLHMDARAHQHEVAAFGVFAIRTSCVVAGEQQSTAGPRRELATRLHPILVAALANVRHGRNHTDLILVRTSGRPRDKHIARLDSGWPCRPRRWAADRPVAASHA